MSGTGIEIEVAYATPQRQEVVRITVPVGTLIGEAVELSGLAAHFPDDDLSSLPKGVWNDIRPDTYQVQAGDRVEIYRRLLVDPKESRRRRARETRKK